LRTIALSAIVPIDGFNPSRARSTTPSCARVYRHPSC
jgi:hypothetical protein